MRSKKKVAIFCCVSMLVFLCSGCGKKEEVQQSTAIEEVTVEETKEVQQPAEEAIVEETVEELSDEEWFKSLNLTDARFMIFNSTTGERKLLENGQQYTLFEGDILAYWYPLDWMIVDLTPSGLYKDVESKFTCIFINLNYDKIGENSELTLHVKDADGNDVYVTVYLSK